MPRGKKKPNPVAGAVIHDHFDGSSNCVECGGECQLTGGNLLATQLARSLVEHAVISGQRVLGMEAHYLEKAGYDPEQMLTRCQQAASHPKEDRRE